MTERPPRPALVAAAPVLLGGDDGEGGRPDTGIPDPRRLFIRPSYVIVPNNDTARRPPSHHGLSDDAYLLYA